MRAVKLDMQQRRVVGPNNGALVRLAPQTRAAQVGYLSMAGLDESFIYPVDSGASRGWEWNHTLWARWSLGGITFDADVSQTWEDPDNPQNGIWHYSGVYAGLLWAALDLLDADDVVLKWMQVNWVATATVAYDLYRGVEGYETGIYNRQSQMTLGSVEFEYDTNGPISEFAGARLRGAPDLSCGCGLFFGDPMLRAL